MVRSLKKSGMTAFQERAAQRKSTAQTVLTALIERGMYQREIADKLGVSQAAISNSLNGRTSFSLGTLTLLISLAKRKRIKLPREIAEWRPL